MKKIIALLLVGIICLSLVACSDNSNNKETDNNSETNNTQVNNTKAEAEKSIIGTWKNENSTVTFKNDNTAVIKSESSDEVIEYRWKYDDELNLYIIVYPQGNPELWGIFIENDNGVDYINLGSKFYRVENNK